MFTGLFGGLALSSLGLMLLGICSPWSLFVSSTFRVEEVLADFVFSIRTVYRCSRDNHIWHGIGIVDWYLYLWGCFQPLPLDQEAIQQARSWSGAGFSTSDAIVNVCVQDCIWISGCGKKGMAELIMKCRPYL